jgi:hypothetical protein
MAIPFTYAEAKRQSPLTGHSLTGARATGAGGS